MGDRLQLLNQALEIMYEVISFPEGGEPDWEGMKIVFRSNARLTRITPEAVDCFDLESFQAMAREMLDRGVYTSFFETEVGRRTEIFGSVAHVLSSYQTKRRPDAVSCLACGVNSIQLVWENVSWRVLSLVWDEVADGAPNRVPLDIQRVSSKENSYGRVE